MPNLAETGGGSLGGLVDSANASDIMHMETPEAGRNALTAGLQQSHFTKGSGQQKPQPQQKSYQGDYSTGDLGKYFDQTAGVGGGALSDIPVIGGLAALGQSKNRGDFINRMQNQHKVGDFNPLHPIDWVRQTKADAESTWGSATRMKDALNNFADPNAVYQSMHNIWSDKHSWANSGLNTATLGGFDLLGQLDSSSQTRWIVKDLLPNLLTGLVRYGWMAPLSELGAGAIAGRIALPATEGALGIGSQVGNMGISYATRLGLTAYLPSLLMDGTTPDQFLKNLASIPGTFLQEAQNWHGFHDEAQNQRMVAILFGAMMAKGGMHESLTSVAARVGSHVPGIDAAGGLMHVGEKFKKFHMNSDVTAPTRAQVEERARAAADVSVPPAPKMALTVLHDQEHSARVIDGAAHLKALEAFGMTEQDYMNLRMAEDSPERAAMPWQQESGQAHQPIPGAEAPKDAAAPTPEQGNPMKLTGDVWKAFQDLQAKVRTDLENGVGNLQPEDWRVRSSQVSQLAQSVEKTPEARAILDDLMRVSHTANRDHLVDFLSKPKFGDMLNPDQVGHVLTQIQRLDAIHGYDRFYQRFHGQDEIPLEGVDVGGPKQAEYDQLVTAHKDAANAVLEHRKGQQVATTDEQKHQDYTLSQAEERARNAVIGHPLHGVEPTHIPTFEEGINNWANHGHGLRAQAGFRNLLYQVEHGFIPNTEDVVGSVMRSLHSGNRVSHHLEADEFATQFHNSMFERWKKEGIDGSKPGGPMGSAKAFRKLMDSRGDLLTEALNSHEVLSKLVPEELSMVQAFRRLTHIVDRKRQSLGDESPSQASYIPLVFGKGKPFTGAHKAASTKLQVRLDAAKTKGGRQLSIDFNPSNHSVSLTNRFGNTPKEANLKMAQARSRLVTKLQSGEAITLTDADRTALRSQGYTNPEAVIQILKDHSSEMGEISKEVASRFANQIFPKFETNLYNIYNEYLPSTLQNLHAREAAHWFTQTIHEDGRAGAVLISKLKPGEQEKMMQTQKGKQGMVHMQGTGFQDWLLHPEIKDYLDNVEKAFTRTQGSKNIAAQILAFQGRVKAKLVYFPMVHTFNVLSRFLAFSSMDMGRVTNEMFGDHHMNDPAMPENEKAFLQMRRRMEAYEAGVMPPQASSNGGGWMGHALGFAGALTGDIGTTNHPGLFDYGDRPPRSMLNRAVHAPGALFGHPLHNMKNTMDYALWHGVDHFGQMVYHVQKDVYMKAGKDEVSARLMAADDANNWMGHVRPERWNAGAYHFAQAALFAPNWWRTHAELMVPMMRDRMGVTVDGNYATAMAAQEWRTLQGFTMMSIIQNNALNMFLAGRPLNQNPDGYKHHVMVERPEIIKFLKGIEASHTTPGPVKWGLESFLPRQYDKNTGTYHIQWPDAANDKHITFRSPLYHQWDDTIKPFGPMDDPTNEGAVKKTAEVALGISNPTVTGLFQYAMNIDLYNTLHTGNVVKIDQGAPGSTGGYLDLLAQLGGLPVIENAAKNYQRDENLFLQDGTIVPRSSKSLIDSLMGEAKGLGTDPWGTVNANVGNLAGFFATSLGKEQLRNTTGALMSQLMGVMPPYPYQAKTAGTHMGEDERSKVVADQKAYQDKALAQATTALSGGMAWSDWRTAYRLQAQEYHNTLKSHYQTVQQATGGIFKLAEDHSAIYDQATDPLTGNVDWAKFDTMDQQFQAKLTQAQRDQLQGFERQSEQRNPMLAVYHQTLRDYIQFQNEAATKVGMEPQALRAAISQYDQAFGDRKLQLQILARNHGLRRYEVMKKAWETDTRNPAGIAYGLFYDSSILTAWMAKHHPGGQAKLDQARVQLERQVAGPLQQEAQNAFSNLPQPEQSAPLDQADPANLPSVLQP